MAAGGSGLTRGGQEVCGLGARRTEGRTQAGTSKRRGQTDAAMMLEEEAGSANWWPRWGVGGHSHDKKTEAWCGSWRRCRIVVDGGVTMMEGRKWIMYTVLDICDGSSGNKCTDTIAILGRSVSENGLAFLNWLFSTWCGGQVPILAKKRTLFVPRLDASYTRQTEQDDSWRRRDSLRHGRGNRRVAMGEWVDTPVRILCPVAKVGRKRIRPTRLCMGRSVHMMMVPK
jgi:hypothetical protein